MTTEIVLCATLDVGYRKEMPVLSSLSLRMMAGESLLVVGHNGAGKSTLLKTFFALLPALSGSVDVMGMNVADARPRDLVMRGVRYLGQGIRAFDWLSVAQSGNVLSRLYRFADSADPSSLPPTARIGSLSVGQRRLEALRLLSVGDPRLYLLDEPCAGLGVSERQAVLRWIAGEAERGCSFIVVEQQFRDFITLFSQTLVVRNGRAILIADNRALTEESLAEVYL